METTRVVEKKLQILRAGGYRYNFDRQLYFNRAAKKAFSVQFIEDQSEDDIERIIRDKSAGPEWRFFFNTTPSAAVERELASVLG